MAIYSVSLKAFSRSKGHSATGACAYRLGLNVVNEQTGERHDFSRRQDVAEAFTMLPAGAPAWEPTRLWNEAEKAEKRKNSTVARELLVALPHELSDSQRSEVSREIAQGLVERYGVAVSVGIHQPDDGGLNHHAHILFSTRRLGPEGFGEKTRELDDLKQGKAEVEHLRESTAEILNHGLERAGFAERVSHKSLEAQREEALEQGDVVQAIALDRAPTKHEGRNPEVKARVEAENDAKRLEARERVQRAMESIEAMARAEHRLMPAGHDTPEAKAKAEMEERHKQQREAMEEAFGRIRAEEAIRVERYNKAVDAAKAQSNAIVEARVQEEREAQAWNLRHIEAQDTERAIHVWRREHPTRERLGKIFPALAREKAELTTRLEEVEASRERRWERLEEAKRQHEEAQKPMAELRAECQEAQSRLNQIRELGQRAVREAEALAQRQKVERDPQAQARADWLNKLDEQFVAVEQVRPERGHRYEGPSL